MNTADENQVIEHRINVIHTSLLELAEADSIYGKNEFRTGQIYAYAECLEVLQLRPTFRTAYLNYDIKNRLFSYLLRIFMPFCFRRVCLFAVTANIPLRSISRIAHFSLLACFSTTRTFLLFRFHIFILSF